LCFVQEPSDRLVENKKGEVFCLFHFVENQGILERSGVGASALLESAGIKCVHELSQVGENLQDHLQMRHVFRVNCSTLNTQSRSLSRVLQIGLDYLWRRRGPLSMAPSQLGVFTNTLGQSADWPNVQFHVQPLSLYREKARKESVCCLTYYLQSCIWRTFTPI
jgi:choline dehydrogenase